MYSAYDCFAYNKERIIRAINTAINKMKIRKGFGTVFYDVTNYYFETDEQTDEVHSKSDYLFDDDGNIKNIYDDAYYELSDEEIIADCKSECNIVGLNATNAFTCTIFNTFVALSYAI